eukprot:7556006-Ditylum_brightwellii.AAC.1
MDKLYNKVKSGHYNKHTVAESYEQLDRQITEIMLGAEKKCRTPKKTGHVWSIKLVTAAREVRYWKTHKSDLYDKRNPSVHLLKLGKDLDVPFKLLPENIIVSKLTAARKELRKVQKNTAEIRNDYLKEMACLQNSSCNTDIATIIKNIRHKEDVKSPFKLIKPIAKGETG